MRKSLTPQRKWVVPIMAGLLWFVSVLATAAPPHPRNILLITIDTIRADHLGCYGYDSIKTPHIDALATNGVLFENAFSPVPLTLPSHTSILTGTYPAFHGVRNNGTFAVPDSVASIAEILKGEGYVTAAFVASYVLDRRFGLDKGFDVYDDILSEDPEQNFLDKERRADAVTRAATEWLSETRPGRFFMWIHYFDPHMHYDPPPPFSRKYSRNPYDGEIAYTDHWIGMLMEHLQKLGLSEDTLVVLTGDHGEGLGAHKEKTHGIFIYDTTLQVPLIISCPRLFPQSQRIRPLVRLIDVAPTILEIAGCKPHKDMQGLSVVPLIRGEGEDMDLVLYCESFYPLFSHRWSPLEGIRTGRWKYIEAPSRELYRLDEDPGERRNLVDREPDEARRLADMLARLKREHAAVSREAPRPQLDDKAKEMLRSLGYVAAPQPKEKEGEYPDPKQMIDTLKHLDRGLEHFGRREYRQARDEFLKVVRKNPQDVDAHTILGHTHRALNELTRSIESFEKALDLGCQDLRVYIALGTMYMKSNRHQEGVDAFRKALDVNPRCKEALIGIALSHIRRNRLDKARSALERALEIDPFDVVALNHLAVIHQRQKRYNDAAAAAQDVLRIDPNNTSALLTLGSTLLYQRQFEEALAILHRAMAIDPHHAKARYFAGLVTFQLRQWEEAVAHFQKAAEIDPNWADPHFNLGYICQQQRDLAGAIKEYRAALEINPGLVQARDMLRRIETLVPNPGPAPPSSP
ncbi:MAG: sulfatase-like hydrolase/transferase [bacterium]